MRGACCHDWRKGLLFTGEMKKAVLLLAILTTLSLGACARNEPATFGIYLAKNGELVLSEEHIASYDAAEHDLELNARGIEKWNSYRQDNRSTLYRQEFIMRVNGREICRGVFTSMISSMLDQGVTIWDTILPLDGQHNKLAVRVSYADDYKGVRYDNVFDELEEALSPRLVIIPGSE